ncbi:hypothetical protein BD626DRAFT_633806 [Schizophyllum amplum]|uniref:Uncharacterized protein n=1 Tax=Schizophyllum amplum TaxID=97359 RepID=A0A550C257_9AGAR|nr:hypothetical protein BD626DRAFT_633806 [Auriculariopsis ampla]
MPNNPEPTVGVEPATGEGIAELRTFHKPRLSSHNHDTPEARSATTGRRLDEFLLGLYGHIRCMATGEDNALMGLDRIHALPRSLQKQEPLKFVVLKMKVGKRITLKDGKTGRGYNLDGLGNIDYLDPTLHRRFDGINGHYGSGIISFVPVDPPLEECARRFLLDGDRSFDEMFPEATFLYRLYVYDGQSFDYVVYDEPVRGCAYDIMSSVPAELAKTDNEDLTVLVLSDDVGDGSRNEPSEEITVIPLRPSTDNKPTSSSATRKQRVVHWPGDDHLLRTHLNPVNACYDIISKLKYRLSDRANWSPEQNQLYDILEPATRGWFPEFLENSTRKKASGVDGDQDPGDGTQRRQRRTRTVPTVSPGSGETSNVRVTRGSAKTRAQTDAAAPARDPPATRSKAKVGAAAAPSAGTTAQGAGSSSRTASKSTRSTTAKPATAKPTTAKATTAKADKSKKGGKTVTFDPGY